MPPATATKRADGSEGSIVTILAASNTVTASVAAAFAARGAAAIIASACLRSNIVLSPRDSSSNIDVVVSHDNAESDSGGTRMAKTSDGRLRHRAQPPGLNPNHSMSSHSRSRQNIGRGPPTAQILSMSMVAKSERVPSMQTSRPNRRSTRLDV
jgi:hypothetical protein